ncbi:MAG: hypothetical protein ACLSA6_16385 [Holdemania massiliensis]
MKKFSVFVAILLCLLGCQAKPTTEETLKAQAELFLQKVDTLPQLSAAVEDEKTSQEEASQLVEEWNKALVEHLKPVMTDQGITNFVANRMPTGFNRFLGIGEEESTAEHRQITSVEPLSGGVLMSRLLIPLKKRKFGFCSTLRKRMKAGELNRCASDRL